MSIKDKVIFIDKTKENDSFFCNQCGFSLISYEDLNYHKEFNTCNECYLTFVESRKEEWKNGWRPDKQKIKEYILLRKSIINK